jgi:hypothetical protein
MWWLIGAVRQSLIGSVRQWLIGDVAHSGDVLAQEDVAAHLGLYNSDSLGIRWLTGEM